MIRGDDKAAVASALARMRPKALFVCETCGAEFEAVKRKSPVRYCSNRCRQAGYVEQVGRDAFNEKRRAQYRSRAARQKEQA